MTVKQKLATAKDKVVTFIKQDGKSLLIGAGVGALAATVYLLDAHGRTLREHESEIQDLRKSDDTFAKAINFLHQNPTLLTPIEGKDDRYRARYVHLDGAKPIIRFVKD